MTTIAQRLNRPRVRAATSGVLGAAIVTAIFALAGGRVSERVLLIPLIHAGLIAGATALALPWIQAGEGQLAPNAQRWLVVRR